MGLQLITGYPSSWRAPFVAAQILLGQGPSNAAAAARAALYCGPKTTAGAWTVNTVYEVKNEQEAIAGAGAGSFLHRMIRMQLKVNPRGRVYAICYAATSGGSPATATSTITWTTAPSAKGQTRVWVCGELVSYAITTSDTVTTIATAIAAAINTKVWLPVTAANVAGVLTLTAKIAGISSGDATVQPIHVRAEIDASVVTTVATSGHLGSVVAGAEGTTTEAANLATALATTTASRYYYKGFSVFDTTATGNIETHVTNLSDPSPGLRCRSFNGYVGTLAACSTIAAARNYERMHIAWQKGSEHDTAELAAWLLAITQKEEETRPTFPGFDDYGNSSLLPAAAESDWPTEADVNDAVTDGICCIKSSQSGARLAMHVTTRSKDAGGTIDDFRACETHRVSGMDYFVDTVLLRFALTFKTIGFFLRDDPRNADGTVNPNGILPPRTTTPGRIGTWLKRIFKEMEDAEIFRDATEWNDTLRVNVDPNNSSRCEVGCSGRTVDILHQASFKVSEATPG